MTARLTQELPASAETTGPAVSSTALLRTAGLPVRLWTAAGAPALFTALREYDHAERRYGILAAATAERIGTELVPDPALGIDQRRAALTLRRALHQAADRGTLLNSRALALLGTVTALAGPDLTRVLTEVGQCALDLADRHTGLSAAMDTENERLLTGVWDLLRADLTGSRALADGTLAAAADIPERLAAGEPWTTKRMRRRSDYLWRMIARGATKTTPRGWLGHVGLVELAEHADAVPEPPELTERVATQWMANLFHTAESARAQSETDGLRWGFEPLHLVDGDQLRLWVIDPETPNQAAPARLRLTGPLASVRTALRGGTLDFDGLAAAILPATAEAPHREALRALLDKLTGLGVLRVSRDAERELTGWHHPARVPGAPVTCTPRPGYLDVHREVSGTVNAAASRDWAAELSQVLRLHRLIDLNDRPGAPPADGERPVLELFAEHMDGLGRGGPPERTYVSSSWAAPSDSDSGYAGLVRLLGTAEETLRLDAAVLDSLGAPDAAESALRWPFDCTLRPLPGGSAVLVALEPAGVYDSRFADGLADLRGGAEPSQCTDYRAFLDRLHTETGVESVELLAPPLAEQAANAVRRPRYTTAWTGDPDLAAHSRPGASPARYLPLDSLVLRTEDGRQTVLHEGRPLRMLYHATRYPQAPWDRLYHLLMAGSPQQRCRLRRLSGTLGALPSARSLPRITMGDSLVLAPAQWRVPVKRLRPLAMADLGAARELDRLRTEFSLPRWVFLASEAGGKPVACDLESLRSLRLLADLADQSSTVDGQVIVEEMLPGPDELTVRDRLDGVPEPVPAELLVRFGAAAPATR